MKNLTLIEDHDFMIDVNSLADGMTQSEMQMWDNCPEKWYLRYNLKLSRKGEFSWATTYGGWIHAALEEFYLTKGKRWSLNTEMKEGFGLMPPALQDMYEYYKGLAKIQMECYASLYKNDFDIWKIRKTEFVVDFVYKGIRLKGMIDVFVKDLMHGGYYVVDHKTSYAINRGIVMGWNFRFQFMFYCWLAWKMWGDKFPIKGFYINAIKKPQLRRGKAESVPAFLKRINKDMLQRPEMYFYRERIRLKKGDLIRFEKTILDPKLQRVRMLRDPKVSDKVKGMLMRNKNTDHCFTYNKPCPYLHACMNGLKAERHQYYVRDVKHQELASDSETTDE